MTGENGHQGGIRSRYVLAMERGRDGDQMSATPQLALPVSVEEQGEVRLYQMVFPFLPPSKNVYDNWPGTWRRSAKLKWVRHITDEVESQMIPKGLRKVGLAATLVFPAQGRRDPQNYSNALWHWVPDALQTAGVLLDDREGCVDIGPNWGIKFAYDTRRGVDKRWRQRTVLHLAVRVP